MIDREKALKKLQKYCAYQDRCHQEVRKKLLSLNVYGDDLEGILAELIGEGYLNEERFAKSYARGKFRIKRWGRNRIKRELIQREISDYCIRKGLEEIDEFEYLETLESIIRKRAEKFDGDNKLLAKDDAIKYASKKGFEAGLIFNIVKEIELSSDNLF